MRFNRIETKMSNEDDFDFFNMDFTTHRYPNRWNEDNWEEELEKHPLFMSRQPDSPDDLPPVVEALQQLKYGDDDNTKDELAKNYKEDGNRNFKLKKYHNAIQCYTAAIKQKIDSKELNSILFANRSAANFYLENYRSSLLDALRSVELNLKNGKAVQRVIQCLNKLEKYDELIKFCENNADNIPNVNQIKKDAEDKLKLKQRDERKSKFKDRKKQDAIIAYQNKILVELNKRKIKFKKDALFDVVHPAAANCKIELNEKDQSISFPVLFVYPEVAMCDFIEKFNENDQFYQHLITMLDDENNQPEWNRNRMFTSENVTVKFKNTESNEFLIDKYDTLGQILKNPKLILNNILLTFSITCK